MERKENIRGCVKINCTPKVRHNTFGVQFILTQPLIRYLIIFTVFPLFSVMMFMPLFRFC